MVKLTILLIEKKCAKLQFHKSVTKEIEKDHLKRITHLFMDEQNIDEISDISICKNLKVIYLQNNAIERIENLNFATNLSHLYLQHNEITKIENLELLVNLKKLFLGYNSIAVVEGLENLKYLSELHIEKQRLAVGERMCFDPRSAKTLSSCLTYLNVSGNKLKSLSEINYFAKLVTLEAKDNLIANIEDLTETVISLGRLEHLYLQGNPVTKAYRYRENLIANSFSLNDKNIWDMSRTFLTRFKTEKLNQSEKEHEIPLSEDITNSLNLPPAFRRSVSRAMFQNVNPKFLFSGVSVVGESHVFPPWKSSSSVKAKKDNHVLPRPFWKNKSNEKKIQKKSLCGASVSFTSVLQR